MANGPLALKDLASGRNFGIGGVVLALFMYYESEQRDLEAQIKAVDQNARTALDVVAQHGDEFNQVRRALDDARGERVELQAQMNLGGRFTSDDGERLRSRFIELRRAHDDLRSHVLELERKMLGQGVLRLPPRGNGQ